MECDRGVKYRYDGNYIVIDKYIKLIYWII